MELARLGGRPLPPGASLEDFAGPGGYGPGGYGPGGYDPGGGSYGGGPGVALLGRQGSGASLGSHRSGGGGGGGRAYRGSGASAGGGGGPGYGEFPDGLHIGLTGHVPREGWGPGPAPAASFLGGPAVGADQKREFIAAVAALKADRRRFAQEVTCPLGGDLSVGRRFAQEAGSPHMPNPPPGQGGPPRATGTFGLCLSAALFPLS